MKKARAGGTAGPMVKPGKAARQRYYTAIRPPLQMKGGFLFMSKRIFTPEQDKEVVALYEQGYSTRYIAGLFHCEKRAVSNALERQGVARRDNRDLTDGEEAQILKIYQAGYSRRRIAFAYGKSQGFIKSALKRQQAKFGDARFNFCEAEEQQIAKIYLADNSMTNIALAYGCGIDTISRLLDRHGIVKREVLHQEEVKPRNDKLIQLYKDGNNLEQVAKMIGLSQSATYRILLKSKVIRLLRKRFFNEQSFDDLNNESSLYWLGFAYSDGYTHRHELKFALALKDTDHLRKLAAFLGEDVQVKTNSVKCWMSVHSQPMIARLRELGIVARRNEFYRLADKIPQGLEHHFIRGYLDGDGCISSRERVIFLGQLDILTWIQSCLVKYAQASEAVKPYQRRGIMEIDFGGYNQFRRVVDYIYQDATIYLERKKEIADKIKRA